MERLLNDFVTVAFDKIEEDEVTMLGPNGEQVKIHVDTKAYGAVDEQDREQVQHKRIYGEVAGLPLGLSDFKLGVKDPGLPRPARHMSHDTISYHKLWQPKEWSKNDYNCGDFRPQFRRLSDLKLNLRLEDRVYVHYDALEPEFYLGPFKTYHMYRVRFDNIICTVQAGDIVMCGGHVLLKPVVVSMEDSKTESGIYLEAFDKPKYMEGTVAFIDSENIHRLVPGDRVFYEVDSDWENTIEGEKYYTMRERDIMVKVQDKKVIPLDDRIFLDLPEAVEQTSSGIIIPGAAQKRPLRSIVRALGVNAAGKELELGDHVYYARGAGMEMEIDGITYWVVRYTDILCKETIS